MSGGEPLSSELEAKLDRLFGIFGHRLMSRDDLRAFAREIQSGKRESVDSVEVNGLADQLLASQSREKVLREALDLAVKCHDAHSDRFSRQKPCDCWFPLDIAKAALSAYPCGRSSEVKPTSLESVDNPITDTDGRGEP